MNKEPIEGEVLDSMPATTQQQGTALVAAESPYMAMAMKAMELDKVDQLEKFMALHERWDAEQQRKAFVAAMSAFKGEAGGITIAKSKHVSFKTNTGKTEDDHAELHDITRALVPMMAKHGLSHRWIPSQEGKSITVACVISHRDGHSESVSLTAEPDSRGGQNSIQAIASTKTYLERYTLLAATGVATGGEMDDDGRSFGQTAEVEYIDEEQQAVLRDLIEAYVTNVGKFMDWIGSQVGYKIESLADIPTKCFDRVHTQLAAIRRQKMEDGTDG